jgi:hypothetical protein
VYGYFPGWEATWADNVVGNEELPANLVPRAKRVYMSYRVVFTFGLLPLLLLGLSIVSPWLCLFVGVPFLLTLLVLVAVIALRQNKPGLLPKALKADPNWLINSLRIQKQPEEVADSAPSTPSSTPSAAMSADLGKGNWHEAPAAWGVGWLVVLGLTVVVFNAKWVDMKYTPWDGRNHYGVSGWGACSYAFKETMAWAPAINEAGCNTTVLNTCGKDLLTDCNKGDFSTQDGANSVYQDSWVGCREVCSTPQWQQWCENQQCGGSKHAEQCKNITETVQRPYNVKYMPAGNAWEEGELCRDVGFLCAGVDDDIRSAADLSVAGLAFATCGLGCLVTHAIRPNFQKILFASLASWILAWILLLVSWAVFASTIGKDAECKVEAESGTGIVIASGKLGDIINGSGSYTFGFVIGAWLLSGLPTALIAIRIKDLRSSKEATVAQGSAVGEDVKPEPEIGENKVGLYVPESTDATKSTESGENKDEATDFETAEV